MRSDTKPMYDKEIPVTKAALEVYIEEMKKAKKRFSLEADVKRMNSFLKQAKQRLALII